MNERTIYLYMLTDPLGEEWCYIGASENPAHRLYAHLHMDANIKTTKAQWLRNLRQWGLEPVLTILDAVPSSQIRDAEEDAISMVRAIRGNACVNARGYSSYRNVGL